jgi:hypothetical protein
MDTILFSTREVYLWAHFTDDKTKALETKYKIHPSIKFIHLKCTIQCVLVHSHSYTIINI